MIRVDKNALICDLAETYKIYDYKEIAPDKVAIFAIGLGDNSRIKLKLSKQKHDFKTLVLAKIADGIELLVWLKTKDAQKGINKPSSILKSLLKEVPDVSAFKSGKDFEIEKQRIINEGGIHYGN